ncbi:NAD-glutamate dehydrogenase [Herminiimonas sp. CN]|uniref:NAD-glutamate dehydrogenase n=1 Tax=Herminiimonas sp. CN TaxID=1349818 RepID=UPI0004741E62|nr:NAD-glutamate dehydrogenase [Herminiimonas sp. CN]
MSTNSEETKAELIGKIGALIEERCADQDTAAMVRFVQEYYAQVDPDDLRERNVQDLYGAALSHWNFLRRFSLGAAKLRVTNPRLEEHGWQCGHTVVEIVNDDMPFLVDSVTMEVNRQGLTLHLLIHPVLCIRRNADGEFLALLDADAADGTLQSVIHMEVDRQSDTQQLEQLRAGIERVLQDVRKAVEDWPRMLACLNKVSAGIDAAPTDRAEAVEIKAFLDWAGQGHFTFLGYRGYDLVTESGEDVLRIVPDSGLGILRQSGHERSASFAVLPPDSRRLARVPQLLMLTKANSRSTVHRPGYLDYIGIKRFDAQGQVDGEYRFLGLYTHNAYSADPAEIPLLRRKIEHVIRNAGFLPGSHAAKDLGMVLETYPRDELFQIGEDDLLQHAMGIVRLNERQRTRLFVRRDPYGRFLSCLIFVPRETYNTELRQRMQQILLEAFNGVSAEFNVQLSESPLARIHFTVRTKTGSGIPEFDAAALEARLAQAGRRWQDEVHAALLERCGEERGTRLYRRYAGAFPAGYREDYSARLAVHDIEMIEQLAQQDSAPNLGLSLYRRLEAQPGQLHFKLFHAGGPVPLSDSLPMLEHMGVRIQDEHPYRIAPLESKPVWVHDFSMSVEAGPELGLDQVKTIFEDSFAQVWRGAAENDDFNRLVLSARFSWREVVILRAYSKYMQQTGFTFSQAYICQTLTRHPQIARQLLELFLARFDPAQAHEPQHPAPSPAAAIESALEQVANLDEDRILRQYLALILATTRTNYFQTDAAGAPKPYLSFKFNPQLVPGLPEPKPMFEIFVYSPRVEGVHLRGGKVARGGLRWSDRMEDFRTEVLGLVKAQMVKNAVIVPVGSKGGFVLKRPPLVAGDRDALQKEGVACYQTFLRGMLDLTDNLVAGKLVPPPNVVRHDADDPYLVVAADKGTATFSDIANGIAHEYGFWLDDAFASGGSVGYDHKKMAITARGAWESVQRHFRELGHDIRNQDFTVAGIGDMSGDVFGNGMLLSHHIKLVAAFDHRHIFLDPEPQTEASFAERQRLFALERSSWADYDPALISAGGGVFPRSAKSVPLSPEARRVLAIEAESLAPTDLIRAILKAPVDLLYNGGIGTYVKSSQQSQQQVGDRANDAVRVDGCELRCKAVGEGGNLGFTQLGRIEYALAGGRIYTDAIDNSGGVDCSDHEVNIKILLNAVVADGELTARQRSALLAEMTEEIAQLVLRDNQFQTQSLSIARAHGGALLDAQARYIRALEQAGKLNRTLEFLPSEQELRARKLAASGPGAGLTAPELAVLLAYSKIVLCEELVASVLPDDPYVATALERYFPLPLRERYRAAMQQHPLKREIIATHVTNSMVNRVGSVFVHRMQEETGASPAEIVRAYLLAREVFGLVSLWEAIGGLGSSIGYATQIALVFEAGRLVERGTLWFLHHRQQHDMADMAAAIARFAPGVATLAEHLGTLLTGPDRSQLEGSSASFSAAGVPFELALRIAKCDALYCALDITEVAAAVKRPAELVAAVYFGLGGDLSLNWLHNQIGLLPADSQWQALARAALLDDLSGAHRSLTAAALALSPAEQHAQAILPAWADKYPNALERYRKLLAELQLTGSLDAAMLTVALREIRGLS